MTKEELLRENVGLIPFLHIEKSRDQIYNAMEEYAKQRALAFSKFKEEYRLNEKARYIEQKMVKGGMYSFMGASDPVIYDEFIKQQTQQP